MRRFFVATTLTALAFAAAYATPSSVLAPFAEIVQGEEPLRVLFVGDIMLDRTVALSAEERGVSALFSTSIRELFAEADVRVGNLEGAVTTNQSIARRDHTIFRFTFDPAVAQQALLALGFDVLSLANNHALDFGAAGYAQTGAYLEAWGVQSFGHPHNNADYVSAVVERKGRALCFIGYHALFSPDTAPITTRLAELRPRCFKIVVFAHWGEEYSLHSTLKQREEAHAFVDAGADLVVGAHPHVVQEAEVYRGRAIFYSLGNFMFDQNFSWETTHSIALRADFYEEETRFTLTPLIIQDQYSTLAQGVDKTLILDRVGLASSVLP